MKGKREGKGQKGESKEVESHGRGKEGKNIGQCGKKNRMEDEGKGGRKGVYKWKRVGKKDDGSCKKGAKKRLGPRKEGEKK